MQRYAVIMAGGSGERFWPASRQARPKQLLRLTDPERTMLGEAIDRIAPLIPPERVLIATNEILAEPIRRGLPEVPPGNVIAEPAKRNTAACLALATAHLRLRHGDTPVTMAVLTADHKIADPERFRQTVDAALTFAETNDALVTIGVRPTRPETGYGYIEIEAKLAPASGAPSPADVRPVARFREKPDLATAREFAVSGHHLWSSGMFFWRTDSLSRGLARHMPALASALPALATAVESADQSSLLSHFSALDDISIDVGLMERAANVHVIPASFAWDDVGAWDALSRTRDGDAQGNVATGDPVLIESHDCIVYNEAGPERIALALIGVRDLVVAATADAVLVCARDRVQDVRRAVAELRRTGRSDKT